MSPKQPIKNHVDEKDLYKGEPTREEIKGVGGRIGQTNRGPTNIREACTCPDCATDCGYCGDSFFMDLSKKLDVINQGIGDIKQILLDMKQKM